MKRAASQLADLSLAVWFSVTVRILFSGLLLLLSAYSVLAYLPDIYYSYIRAPFQAWLPWLIHHQPWIFASVALPLCVTLFLESDKRPVRRLVVEFTILQFAAALFFAIVHPIAHLEDDSRSFIWAMVLLFPILFLGLIDRVAHLHGLADALIYARRWFRSN